METKICTKCKKELPKTTEYFRKKSNGYWISRCKKCTSEDNKLNHARYYKKNKEKVNAKNLENYYKKHPKEVIPNGYKRCYECGEIKPITIKYFGKLSKSKDGFKYSCKACRNQKEYLLNREDILKKRKKWYLENKPEHLRKTKEYHFNNINSRKEWDRQYYKRHKEKIKENVKRNFYNRIESDIGFKLLQRCRARLYKAIKGYNKSARTKQLIGCDVEQLLKHLEEQFKDGMTWENYGEWHIDHIIPCSSFDFSKEGEQFKCFNYKNLQPLWARENQAKSNKIRTL